MRDGFSAFAIVYALFPYGRVSLLSLRSKTTALPPTIRRAPGARFHKHYSASVKSRAENGSRAAGASYKRHEAGSGVAYSRRRTSPCGCRRLLACPGPAFPAPQSRRSRTGYAAQTTARAAITTSIAGNATGHGYGPPGAF